MSPAPYPDELRRAVIEADSNGEPRVEIAERFGISTWTIRSWAGTKRQRNSRIERRLQLRKQARDLHWQGYTYVYIAKQIGVPVSTVWDYINRPYNEALEPKLPG